MPDRLSRGMFTVSVAYGSAFVMIAASGEAGVPEICGALALGGEIAGRSGKPRFVFDLLAVEFDGSISERQEIGRFAATLLRHVQKIAVVLSPETHTGAGEKAAQEAGLNLRNFASLPEALDWLAA
jgi:hypothetical protein